MEMFETPPQSPQEVQTLVETSLVTEKVADCAQNWKNGALKGSLAAMGLGLQLGGAQETGVNGFAFSGGEGEFVGVNEKKRDGKENGLKVDGGDEAVQGLGFALPNKVAVENGSNKMAVSDDSVQGIVAEMGAKLDGDCISVVGELHGSGASLEQEMALETEGVNFNNLGKNSERNEVGDGEGLVPVPEMSEDEDLEEIVLDEEEHEFSVGDFVWGKVQSHPWWPGRVYSPSDASDYATKYKQKDRYLVAYFGDGSFSWCYQSQLVPFVENFESMLKQSESKNFVYAVHDAVTEFGRLVELDMTCNCTRKDDEFSDDKPMAANAGIKGGVMVPEGGLGKLSVAQWEPAELIADLNNMAQVVSANDMLELTVLKSRLAAIYNGRGGYQLPAYSLPIPIVGLEDKNSIPVTENGSFINVPIACPSEEQWFHSPAGTGSGQTSQSPFPAHLKISADKLYQRRKQKSVAELMGKFEDIGPDYTGTDKITETSQLEKLASESLYKLAKDNGHAQIHIANASTTPKRRGRKPKHSAASTMTEIQVSYGQNGGSGEKGVPKKRGRKRKADTVENDGGKTKEREIPTSDWEKTKDSSPRTDDGDEATQGSQKAVVSRERKKSKYLSPPYTTDVKQSLENLSSKDNLETEVFEVNNVAPGPQHGSPPTMKCSSQTFQKLYSENGAANDLVKSQRFQELAGSGEKMIDVTKTTASPNEVLSELQYAATDHQDSGVIEQSDTLKGFLSVFRSSTYREGSNYQVYNKPRRGRKRKSLHPEPGSVMKNLNQTDTQSHEEKLEGSRDKKKEAKLDVSMLKRAPVASEVKADDTADKKAASSAVLFVSFPPVFSLPSKDELISIYRKFGPLNELETNVSHKSLCGMVVFLRTADAERAFEDSVKSNPFGAAKVTFRLRYPSVPPRVVEVNEDMHVKTSSLPEGSMAPENSSLSESLSLKVASQFNFIKQKLEFMSSMLETSHSSMSPEMRSNLKGEMGSLLEKVSVMAVSYSS